LKLWKENIQLFFTFSAEAKAEQYLRLAEVRLAEYQKMIEKGKQEIAEKTIAKYQNQLDRAVQKAQELKEKGIGDVIQKVEGATSKHLQVLQDNLAKVPEAAKKGLERAIEALQKGIEKIKGAVEKNKEAPSEISSDTLGWQTYQNEEGGYAFKYPNEWNAVTSKYNSRNALFGPGATSEGGIGGVTYRGALPSGRSLLNFIKESNEGIESGSISETETVINGNNVVISILPKASLVASEEGKNVSFVKNGKIFGVGVLYKTDFVKYPEDKQRLTIFNQILSTFKFIEPK